MSIYSTKIKANKADQAEFTNPFTNQVYKRGELNVKVNSKELVGERAMAIMKRQTDSIISTTHPDFPAIIDPTHIAIGPFVSGLDDNLFIDTVLGVGTNGVFGYNHPKVFPRLQKLGSIIPGYMAAGTDFFFDSRHGAPAAQDLAEMMCAELKTAYGEEYMMNFANAGTESNENALKVAMFSKFRRVKEQLSDKQYDSMCEQLEIKKVELPNDTMWSNYPFFIIAFKGAFHGRTTSSNTISYSKRRQKEGYQSIPYVMHLPYNEKIDFTQYIDTTPLKELIEKKNLKAVIDEGKIPADLLAGIIMEPIQGEGGYIVPESDFLDCLNTFLGKYRSRGVILISDEVQTGLYRTGTFSGMQNWYKDYPNLKPDVLSFAKPLHVGGVMVQKRLLNDWPAGKFSGTWSEGNLLAIAVAVYTLEELKNEDPTLGRSYQENCVEAGKYLRGKLSQLAETVEDNFPGTCAMSNIRGVGQMNAFDMPDGDLVNKVVHQAFLHGMHILGTGPNSIRIFGTVDQREREADLIVEVLEDVILNVLKDEADKSSEFTTVSVSKK
ncbi:MAG: aminotransferase class III-fold pyridoxal phosphate-dependent enzyme [Cyanobacteriota/Melainabacteria group bacterium]